MRETFPESQRRIQRRRFGSALAFLLGALQMVQPTFFCRAQENTIVHPADPQILGALRQVSAERIQQTVDKLVSFGTRSTLSAQDEDSIKAGKGIGAAREWIKSEFERYSKDCGGCLEVKTNSFLEPPANHIPNPTPIPNIYPLFH